MKDFGRSDDPRVQAQLDRLAGLSVPQGRLGLETIRAMMDRLGDPELIGKHVGQDDRLDRPSAVRELGVKGATELLRDRIEAAVESVPDCRGKHALRTMIHHEASRLLNNALNARRAA